MAERPAVPFYLPEIDRVAALALLSEALERNWLTTGPLTARFEEALQGYLKTKHLLAVSSATAALQLALRVLGIGPGDRVLVPANTFIATFETVHLAGAVPVLCDIDPHTWNISLDEINRRGDGAAAVMAVPFAGNSLPMKELADLCRKKNLRLILDNAHALETLYDGEPLHHFADAACYSFYATKNLTTAEGGALVLRAGELMPHARALCLHGMSREAWNRYRGGGWRYDILDFGYKYNLSDIHAALGLVQIPHIESNLLRREQLVARYRSGLQSIGGIRLQAITHNSRSAHHLFAISLSQQSGISRDGLSAFLTGRGIGHSVHFIPLYQMHAVREHYRYNETDYPHTADYFQGALTLPLYPALTDAQVDAVVHAIGEYIQLSSQ